MSAKPALSQNSNPFVQPLNKRTRSQLRNFAFDFTLQLDRSPLKDARETMRRANRLHQTMDDGVGKDEAMKSAVGGGENSACPDVSTEDEILLSPKKRASSPLDEDPRTKVKRVKRDVQGTLPALFARQISKQTPKLQGQNAHSTDSSSEGRVSNGRLDVTQSSVSKKLRIDADSSAVQITTIQHPTELGNTLQPLTASTGKTGRKNSEIHASSAIHSFTNEKPHADRSLPILETPLKTRMQGIPHLDLTTVTPSPWKGSPAKQQLRIVSEGSVSRKPLALHWAKVAERFEDGCGSVKASQSRDHTDNVPLPPSLMEGHGNDVDISKSAAVEESMCGSTLADASEPLLEQRGDARVEDSRGDHAPMELDSVRPLTVLATPIVRAQSPFLNIQQVSDPTQSASPSKSTQAQLPSIPAQEGFLDLLPLSSLTYLPPSPQKQQHAHVVPSSPSPIRARGSLKDITIEPESHGPASVVPQSRLPRPSSGLFTNAGTASQPADQDQDEKLDRAEIAKTTVVVRSNSTTRRTKLASTSSARASTRAPMTRSVALKEKQKQRAASVQPTSRLPSPVPTTGTVVKNGGKQRAASVQPTLRVPSPVKPSIGTVFRTDCEEGKPRTAELKRSTTLPHISPGRPSFAERGRGEGVESGIQSQALKGRKSFVLTIPSSLSPVKSSSSTNPAISATRMLYPPPITDEATKARSQSSLSILGTALEKLALPAPTKPNTREDGARGRPRPSTSMGFNNDLPDLFSPSSSSSAENAKVNPTFNSTGMGLKRTGSALGRVGSMNASFGRKPFFPPSSFGIGTSKGKEKALPPPMRFGMNGGAGGSGGGRAALGVGGAIFKRPFEKASRKTTLDTVEGSPVKDGATSAGTGNALIQVVPATEAVHDEDWRLRAGTTTTEGGATGNTVGEISSRQGKEAWHTRSNASRRASLAFSTLSQSLSELPGATDLAEKSSAIMKPSLTQRSASATRTSSRALRSAVLSSTPTLSSSSKQTLAAGLSTAPAAIGGSDSESGKGSGAYVKKKASNRTKMPGSLDVLNDCTIFVDVRTDEGEDAGGLFIDMLRGLGAKVLASVGQTCTHIVYKNGMGSTLTRYRILDEPRPSVVGIGWVVECVEKRERIDETRFQVDLDGVNVSGSHKRRRSMLPRQMFMNDSARPFAGGHRDDNPVFMDTSADESSILSGEGDSCRNNSSGSMLLHDSEAPLERARRRSIMLSRT